MTVGSGGGGGGIIVLSFHSLIYQKTMFDISIVDRN